MTEEKAKKKTTSKKKDSDKITLSKNELSEVITNALLEYDKKKKEQEEQEYYAKKETEKLGFRKFMKLLFFPKKNLNTKDANVDIVRGFIKVKIVGNTDFFATAKHSVRGLATEFAVVNSIARR